MKTLHEGTMFGCYKGEEREWSEVMGHDFDGWNSLLICVAVVAQNSKSVSNKIREKGKICLFICIKAKIINLEENKYGI